MRNGRYNVTFVLDYAVVTTIVSCPPGSAEDVAIEHLNETTGIPTDVLLKAQGFNVEFIDWEYDE